MQHVNIAIQRGLRDSELRAQTGGLESQLQHDMHHASCMQYAIINNNMQSIDQDQDDLSSYGPVER